MRERLATPDEEEWRQAAEELAVIGAMGDIDPELRERVRQRGRELGSLNRAIDELAKGKVKPPGCQNLFWSTLRARTSIGLRSAWKPERPPAQGDAGGGDVEPAAARWLGEAAPVGEHRPKLRFRRPAAGERGEAPRGRVAEAPPRWRMRGGSTRSLAALRPRTRRRRRASRKRGPAGLAGVPAPPARPDPAPEARDRRPPQRTLRVATSAARLRPTTPLAACPAGRARRCTSPSACQWCRGSVRKWSKMEPNASRSMKRSTELAISAHQGRWCSGHTA